MTSSLTLPYSHFLHFLDVGIILIYEPFIPAIFVQKQPSRNPSIQLVQSQHTTHGILFSQTARSHELLHPQNSRFKWGLQPESSLCVRHNLVHLTKHVFQLLYYGCNLFNHPSDCSSGFFHLPSHGVSCDVICTPSLLSCLFTEIRSKASTILTFFYMELLMMTSSCRWKWYWMSLCIWRSEGKPGCFIIEVLSPVA